jgi:WD40 repeat protein
MNNMKGHGMEPIIFDAHGRHAQSVLFPSKQQSLVSSGMDSNIHIWSIPGFERVSTFDDHENSVNTLSLDPSETRLASGSSDATVRIWSFPDGDLMSVLEKQVNAVFHPDGSRLWTIGSNGRVSYSKEPFGSLDDRLPAEDKRIFEIEPSPNGEWLMIGGTGSIVPYNIEKSELGDALPAHQLAVPDLKFTSSGQYLLSTGAEGALQIWDPQTWGEIERVDLPAKGVLQMAITPDDETVFVSMDNKIAAYSIPDGQLQAQVDVPIKGVYGLAVSPDGNWLANAGADGNLRIWKISDLL